MGEKSKAKHMQERYAMLLIKCGYALGMSKSENYNVAMLDEGKNR